MNSKTARISAAQLAVLLVLSRLFILLIFVPDTAQAPAGPPPCWESCWDIC